MSTNSLKSLILKTYSLENNLLPRLASDHKKNGEVIFSLPLNFIPFHAVVVWHTKCCSNAK